MTQEQIEALSRLRELIIKHAPPVYSNYVSLFSQINETTDQVTRELYDQINNSQSTYKYRVHTDLKQAVNDYVEKYQI